jgi:pyruvate dehydrogenase E2 component (dihydrolipoamide acetyltransferase)
MTEDTARHLEPLTPMRAAIARRMSESKRNAPHIYLTTEIDMESLVAALEGRNAKLHADHHATITAAIARAVALTLVDEPALNAHWTDEGPVRFEPVNLGIAIALDDGLIAPALLDVASLDLPAISGALRDLVTRARAGRVRARELTEGTFTLTNLGAYPISEFGAIINPPQVGILATGRAEARARVVDGAVVARTTMRATLSADHRAIDGVIGARFLERLKVRLEAPGGWIDGDR